MGESNGVGNRSPLGGIHRGGGSAKKGPLARMGSGDGEGGGGKEGSGGGGKLLYSHEDGVVALREPPSKIQASEPQTDEEILQAWTHVHSHPTS